MNKRAIIRRENQRRLVRRLLSDGPVSRVELARRLGVSAVTTGRIVEDLLRDGVLLEMQSPAIDTTHQRLGRPAQLVDIDRQTPRFLAIQVGVLHTRVSTLPLAGRPEATDQWQARFATPHSADTWAGHLRDSAAGLLDAKPWGVLVSVPGVVDEEEGKVLFSPNLHWLEKADLIGMIGKLWDAPVILVQETQALAMGHLAAEGGPGDFLLVDFGHGVGGAAMIKRQLYAAPLPLSGELGHTPVAGNDRPCGCGARGCLETLVSRRGLMQTFHQKLGGERDWMHLTRRLSQRGMESWLEPTLEAAAGAIAGALNVLGLRRVIITGSLTELPGAVVEELARLVQRGAMWARFGKVECQSAPRRRGRGLAAAGVEKLLLHEENRIFVKSV